MRPQHAGRVVCMFPAIRNAIKYAPRADNVFSWANIDEAHCVVATHMCLPLLLPMTGHVGEPEQQVARPLRCPSLLAGADGSTAGYSWLIELLNRLVGLSFWIYQLDEAAV